jgi:hypothetical protein
MMPNVPDWTDVLPQPPRRVPGYRNVEMASVLLRVAERYELNDYK